MAASPFQLKAMAAGDAQPDRACKEHWKIQKGEDLSSTHVKLCVPQDRNFALPLRFEVLCSPWYLDALHLEEQECRNILLVEDTLLMVVTCGMKTSRTFEVSSTHLVPASSTSTVVIVSDGVDSVVAPSHKPVASHSGCDCALATH